MKYTPYIRRALGPHLFKSMRHFMPRIALIALLFAPFFIGSSIAQTNSQLNSQTKFQTTGVIGQWREPGGSVIEVHPCGNEVCARLAFLPPETPAVFDTNNPNPAQRSRPLCGLQIGWGFHLVDPTHATGGMVYDPRSGSSYRGTLTASGNTLDLRGYAWLKIFGRNETWTRVGSPVPACPR
jgi:uncharacterized protein (DUF2147 family)